MSPPRDGAKKWQRESAQRTVHSSNLRQIGMASLIHAGERDGRLPPAMVETEDGERETTIHDVAFLLATRAGLNDAQLWVSQADRAGGAGTGQSQRTDPPLSPGRCTQVLTD